MTHPNEAKTVPAVLTNDDRKLVIVTIKRKWRCADMPEMTPEAYKRRGNLADAQMRRLIGKDQP